MTIAVGSRSKAAISALASASPPSIDWSTAWSMSDLDSAAVAFVSESISRNITAVEIPVLDGSAGRTVTENATKFAQGDIVMVADYYNMNHALKALFGAYEDDTLNLCYRFSLDDSYDDIFFLAIDKVAGLWKVGPCIATGGSLALTSNTEPARLTLNTFAKWATVATSGYPNVSLSGLDPILFPHVAVKVGDINDALTDGDKVNVNSFTLTINHNLATDHYAMIGSDAVYPLVPVLNGYREVTLELSLPRFDDSFETATNGFQYWRNNDTILQVQIEATNGTDTMYIYIPYAKITDGFEASVDGPDVIDYSGTLTCFQNDGNTAMTNLASNTISEEVQIEITHS